jgi:putative endonuclease
MKAFVYILQDDLGRHYIGSTSNLELRINQHQNKSSRYTKRLQNIKLALKQEYPDITMARKVENRLKKLKRKDYIEKIIKDGYIKMK